MPSSPFAGPSTGIDRLMLDILGFWQVNTLASAGVLIPRDKYLVVTLSM